MLNLVLIYKNLIKQNKDMKSQGENGVPIAKNGVQMNDEFFLLRWECTTLEVWSQVIDPTKTATFATPLKTSIPSNVTPTPLSICQHVPYEPLIFIWWPQPFSQLALNVVHFVLVGHQIRFPHLPTDSIMLVEWYTNKAMCNVFCCVFWVWYDRGLRERSI